MGFPGGSEVKASASNAGDPGSIHGSGRSPGEGNDNPLQYFCLENPMDGEAWQATVHGVAKSRTRLSDFTFTLRYEQFLLNLLNLFGACQAYDIGKILIATWERLWKQEKALIFTLYVSAIMLFEVK